MDQLGKRIKQAREAKQLSQEKLASLCGVSGSAVVSNWEIERSEPAYDTLAKLCTILDVSPNYFLGYDEPNGKKTHSPALEQLTEDIEELGPDFFEKIRALTDDEMTRREEIRKSYNPHEPTFQIQYPLFLDKSDPEYDSNKKLVKKIIKTKSQSGKTDWEITEFLWAAGYKDIRYGDVISILSLKIKVPNSQLLRHIQSYLDHSYNIVFPN